MYDYIVIGGGSAGCTMAARLSEIPELRVLLLEAGPPDHSVDIHRPVAFYKMTGGPLTWGYKTAPMANVAGREVIYPQARVLGGGSSINAMVYTRGHPEDYDEWADEEGCDGWAFDDVLPYFRKAEDNERFANDMHGTGGPIGVSDPISPHPLSKTFVRAAQQAGIPYNPDLTSRTPAGCGLYQVFQRGGRRCSAAVGYLGPARPRRNLEIVTDCFVTKIIVEQGRAAAVAYEPKGSSEPKRAELKADGSGEIILAAGAIGSPKLMLLSGIGPAAHLKEHGLEVIHDLPGVGRNLQDHPDIYAINELTGPISYDVYKKPFKKLLAGIEYYAFGRGPVTSNLAEAGGFWWANESARSPDIQFHFLPGAGLEAGVGGSGIYGCTLNSCIARPKSRGWVRLKSPDPRESPEINPNYWDDPDDLATSVKGFKLVRKIMAQAAFKPFIKRESQPGSEVRSDDEIAEYGRQYGKTDYHPVGTCKMGTDAMAVVDPQLRVRGIERLRIADSSIMPRLISSNTNAASIMIGEKAADMIRGNR